MATAIIQRSERRPKRDATPPQSWAWIAIGGVLLLFANGGHTIALAAWLAPVFLLRFVRLQRPLIGMAAGFAVLTVTFAYQLKGMAPIPGVAYYIFLAATGLILLVPYFIDRVLAPRLRGAAHVLLFPSAWTASAFLASLGPYGSWGSVAYSQYGNLGLLQLLSVTGLWGIAFLIGWFASAVNEVWEQGWESRLARRSAVVFAGVFAMVMLLGEARLVFFPPSSATVRVASLSKASPSEPRVNTWRDLQQQEIAALKNWSGDVNNDLLARAEREAKAGARIIFWGETNAPVFKEDEAALIARGRELARKYQIYLGMALGTWNRGQDRPLENKLVLIRPDGQVVWEYFKAHPVPGSEAGVSMTSDGRLRSLDTPYGNLSAAICFDMDFPRLLAQAGALRADVLIAPSNDWRAIDPWHTQMASFRAIEQGFNLVRHTSNGLSAAYDYQGRRLAAMDHFQAPEHTLISEVPTRGVRTFYSRFGDWLGWLSLAGVAVLAVLSLRRP